VNDSDPEPNPKPRHSTSTSTSSGDSHSASGNHPAADGPAEPLRIRYRVRFAKTGLLRWIGHQDLARLWERLVRRAALKLSMTEGFHPKPRIAFPSALALGVDSRDEVVELELAEQLTPSELLERLLRDEQPGLVIVSVGMLPAGFSKAQLAQSDYIITPPDNADWEKTAEAIENLMAQDTVSIQRKKKTLTLDLTSQIKRLEIRDSAMHLSLAASQKASLRPGDVMDLLDLNEWIPNGASITRTRVRLEQEFESDDPQLMAVAQRAPAVACGDYPFPPNH